MRARSGSLTRFVLAVAILAVVLSLGLRVENVLRAPFDEDETVGLYHGWRITQGDVMNVDWWEPRAPLPLTVNAKLLGLFPQSANIVVEARVLYQVAALLALLFFFLGFRRVTGTTAALFALAIFSSFSFIVSRTSQARPDVLFLLFLCMAYWAFIRYEESGKRKWMVWSGALMALAALSKQTGVFPLIGVAAYFLWTPLQGRRTWTDAAKEGLVFAGGFAGAFVVAMLLFFGRHVGQGIYSFFFEGWNLGLFSESQRPFGLSILDPLLFNAPLWIVGVISFVGLHVIALGAKKRNERSWPAAFLLTQCWVAFLYLAVRGIAFEQDFLFPALTLSAAAAFLCRGLIKKAEGRKAASALIALGLAFSTMGPLIGSEVYRLADLHESVEWHRALQVSFIDQHTTPSDLTPDADALGNFLLGPHRKIKRPAKTQERQKLLLDWLLEHVGSNEYALSGNNLPIYRRQSHNSVRAETWDNLLSADLVAAGSNRLTSLCRAEPISCEKGLSKGQKILMILSQRPPEIIVLDYPVDGIIFEHHEVRAWVERNYKFVYLEKMLTWVGVRSASAKSD